MNCPMCGELWDGDVCLDCGWKEKPNYSVIKGSLRKENVMKKLITLLLFLAVATATIMADGPEPIPLCWPWPACSK